MEMMETLNGPFGAILEYNTDHVDPFSIGGVQKEWNCLSEQLCDWPYCKCDPVATAIIDQSHNYSVTVPATSTNHRMIQQARMI